MTFGMPRALFAVLAVSVYHAGASGTGVLYASVAVGSNDLGAAHGLDQACTTPGSDRDLGSRRLGRRHHARGR